MKLLLNILFFIFIININKSYSLVVLPLKTLPKENYIFYKDNSELSTIKKYFHSDIYTLLNIGGNHQQIPLFISISKSIFQITSSLSRSSTKFDSPEIYNMSSLFNSNKLLSFFNEEKSSTFLYNDLVKSENKKTSLANDTIFFYDKLDLNSNINKVMNFELLKQFQTENLTGEIGLAFPDKKLDNYQLIKATNLLSQLKQNKMINNYNWFFLYDKWDNNDGKLIIGASPHDLLPKKYKQKDLIYAKSLADSSMGHNWKIKFKDIFFDSFHLKNLTAEFIFDSELTVAPKELDTLLLKLFLQEEINNKNCEQGRYYQKSHYVTTFKYYYCKADIQKELYEALPNIKLNSKEFNYTFELSKDDLLQVEYNQVFLKILFFIEDSDTWLLGKAFSLKYQFVFNPDAKEIGMYNPDYVAEKPGRNMKQFWLVVTIIILCIVFTILGIIIGKKIYGLKRKQKANELTDDFEYVSAADINKGKSTNSINDIKRNNNFDINKTVSSYKSIEMNTKLY
jgi:hypothetical protein